MDIETAAATGVPTEAVDAAAPDTALGDAINDFGFDLAREVTGGQEGNVIVSPLSVHVALAMCANGAGGGTRDEMAEVLRVDADMAASNTGYANLIAALMQRSGEGTVSIANSLWTDPKTTFEQTFLDTDRKYFGAEVSTLDFSDPAAADTVNEWVADNTNGRIDKLVDAFAPATVLALVNAVHFLADWEKPFESDATQPDIFTLASDDEVEIDFMNQTDTFAYFDNEDLQLVRMGYAGGRYAAYVVVPREGVTPDDLLTDMDAGAWRDLVASADSREGHVMLPSMELDWKAELSGQLQAMGLESACTPEADFSGITKDSPLWIGTVDHATYLRVDEKGTEAAAATSIGMLGAAMPGFEEPPFELRADKPFLFVIADEPTGALLFLGRIEDPR